LQGNIVAGSPVSNRTSIGRFWSQNSIQYNLVAFEIPVHTVGNAAILLRSGVDANMEGPLWNLTTHRNAPVRFRSGVALHTGTLWSVRGMNLINPVRG
jgi:hypothetical protein